MILVAAGSPGSIKRLSEIARPITQEGRIVVAGFDHFYEEFTQSGS
jgi:hypothetical protein